MGLEKIPRPLHYREDVQALTSTSTGTRVQAHGITRIDQKGTSNKVFLLNPPIKGVRKVLHARFSSTGSTGDVTVATHSSAVTFLGSTTDAITFSVPSTAAPTFRSAEIVGLSSASWAVVSRTTGTTLVASTR